VRVNTHTIAPGVGRILNGIDDLMHLLSVGHADVGTGGENVNLLSHALQCADLLARQFPDDIELQVAGLLHDIGHHIPLAGLRERLSDHELAHGREGARVVRPLLGPRVAELIELHVPAKRYLVSVEGGYGGVLSPASIHTLARQGGAMTDHEATAFLANPNASSAIDLRRADDEAKVPGRATSSLVSWYPVLVLLATVSGEVQGRVRETTPYHR
jgi:predicted HD phosphohydrolase